MISQSLLAVPVVALYALSIIIAYFTSQKEKG